MRVLVGGSGAGAEALARYLEDIPRVRAVSWEADLRDVERALTLQDMDAYLLHESLGREALYRLARNAPVGGTTILVLEEPTRDPMPAVLDGVTVASPLSVLGLLETIAGGHPTAETGRQELEVAAACQLARPQTPGVAVVVADIDGFSAVTDALGVETGDLLLEAVAERLTSSVRGTDVVKRLGGDEFGVLLVGANQRPIVDRWIGRLRESLLPPLRVGNREIGVTLSMGIAVSEPGRTARGLLSAATLAMRRAKERGPGSAAMYEPEMHTEASRRFHLGSALRKAVLNQQLCVHYQPIVDLRTHRLSGFEALCRWRSDELGPVPPATFIPLAEQLGLIDALDSWVLRQACAQMVAWDDRHEATAAWLGQPHPIMNVNVSGRRFCSPTLVDAVLTTLRDVGLPPAQLRLEITESALLDDPDAARRNIARLRTHEVTVSIDDFGTGYSSLSYLSHLPVAALKIDRSFVASLEDSPRAPIVRTVLALARELGIGVTAEGVENPAQLARLQALGCDRVQGYFFARPAAPASMSPFLNAPTMLAP